MKKLVLFLMVASILGCSGQPSSISNMEYGDCEPELELVPMNIYFENVIDFVYDSVDDMFIIEYADSDIIDTDSIQINGEWNTLDYFQIECSEEDFFNVLEEYSVWLTTKRQKNIDWGFIEIVTPVEGGLNYRYNLVSL